MMKQNSISKKIFKNSSDNEKEQSESFIIEYHLPNTPTITSHINSYSRKPKEISKVCDNKKVLKSDCSTLYQTSAFESNKSLNINNQGKLLGRYSNQCNLETLIEDNILDFSLGEIILSQKEVNMLKFGNPIHPQVLKKNEESNDEFLETDLDILLNVNSITLQPNNQRVSNSNAKDPYNFPYNEISNNYAKINNKVLTGTYDKNLSNNIIIENCNNIRPALNNTILNNNSKENNIHKSLQNIQLNSPLLNSNTNNYLVSPSYINKYANFHYNYNGNLNYYNTNINKDKKSFYNENTDVNYFCNKKEKSNSYNPFTEVYINNNNFNNNINNNNFIYNQDICFANKNNMIDYYNPNDYINTTNNFQNNLTKKEQYNKQNPIYSMHSNQNGNLNNDIIYNKINSNSINTTQFMNNYHLKNMTNNINNPYSTKTYSNMHSNANINNNIPINNSIDIKNSNIHKSNTLFNDSTVKLKEKQFIFYIESIINQNMQSFSITLSSKKGSQDLQFFVKNILDYFQKTQNQYNPYLMQQLQALKLKIINVSSRIISNKFGSYALQKSVLLNTIEERIQILNLLAPTFMNICYDKIGNNAIQLLIDKASSLKEQLTIIRIVFNNTNNIYSSYKENLENIKDIKNPILLDTSRNPMIMNINHSFNLLNLSLNEFGYHILMKILTKFYHSNNSSNIKLNEEYILILQSFVDLSPKYISNKFGVNVAKTLVTCLLDLASNTNLTSKVISSIKKLLKEIVINTNKYIRNIIKEKYGFYAILFLFDNIGFKSCYSTIKILIDDIEELCVKSYGNKLVKKLLAYANNFDKNNKVGLYI